MSETKADGFSLNCLISLCSITAFEFDTIMYPADQYWWQWNERNNLEGYTKTDERHLFTWQPHGSQFTIIENVPEDYDIYFPLARQ